MIDSSDGAMKSSVKKEYALPNEVGFSKAPSDSRGTESGPPMPL